MIINRVWAMPNHLTFTIKPIKELLERYIEDTDVVLDGFANSNKWGTITNDLNPEFDTDYNIDALSFLKQMFTEKADVVLHDPPYSITQASRKYKEFGKVKLERHVSNMGYWADIKDETARTLKKGGIAISCGWNSNGVGKKRGFEIIEILIVAHGGSKNNTIVVVERKL